MSWFVRHGSLLYYIATNPCNLADQLVGQLVDRHQSIRLALSYCISININTLKGTRLSLHSFSTAISNQHRYSFLPSLSSSTVITLFYSCISWLLSCTIVLSSTFATSKQHWQLVRYPYEPTQSSLFFYLFPFLIFSSSSFLSSSFLDSISQSPHFFTSYLNLPPPQDANTHCQDAT